MRIVPYGAWPSPLTPEGASAARVSVSALQVSADGTWWWSESRPEEGGRQVVMRRPPGADPEPASPDGVSVRTRVHEYGGTAFAVADGVLVYASLEDEAMWEARPGTEGATRLTDPPPDGERHRYGEPQPVARTPWVIAVRERHRAGAVDDELVAVRRSGSGAAVVLASGRDFFAAPRPSPDGSLLAWVAWDHPDMPWDASELWVAPILSSSDTSPDPSSDAPSDPPSDPPRLGPATRVAGGPGESVGQPTWAGDGTLYFVSDRRGWWQPHRWVPGTDSVRRLCDEEADFHGPDWALGQATLAPLPGGRLACRVRRGGRDHIVVVGADGTVTEVDQPCVSITALRAADAHGAALALIGATPDAPTALHGVALPGPDGGPASATTVVHRPRPSPLAAPWVSVGAAHTFPTTQGLEAHLLYFPPTGEGICGPAEAPPPLIVGCHGGPTGAAEPGFDLGVQLWTSRGYAVALVDYRGSAGYGRAYRELLDGLWGLADADDCAAAARFLAGRGLADGERMLVRGSSAGGLTALRALRPGGPFRGALVSYGVTDLRALACDTHKFEARYLDRLVGPWPEAAAVYEARSPALHPEEIEGAVLLLQGEDDPIVPAGQARAMAEALGRQGGRCRLELFPGEGHGFRRAESLARAAASELAFASSILGVPAPA